MLTATGACVPGEALLLAVSGEVRLAKRRMGEVKLYAWQSSVRLGMLVTHRSICGRSTCLLAAAGDSARQVRNSEVLSRSCHHNTSILQERADSVV